MATQRGLSCRLRAAGRSFVTCFYDMTNAVPHAGARWLDAGDMRGWLARTLPDAANDNGVEFAPRIAYLDVTAATP